MIHLTDKRKRHLAMIGRNGITARAVHGCEREGFATPVTRNYFLSYQWLRELRRTGIRTVSAVQFHLDDDAEVTIGKYNAEPVSTTAADAVRLFMRPEPAWALRSSFPSRCHAKASPAPTPPGRSPDGVITRNPMPTTAGPAAARIASVDKSGAGWLRTAYEAPFNAP